MSSPYLLWLLFFNQAAKSGGPCMQAQALHFSVKGRLIFKAW